MITLASHKTFAEKVAASQATAALFIYSSKDQAKASYDPAVKKVGKRNCSFQAVQMNDVQPGRNKGNALPSVASVIDIVKFFALHHDEEVVVCDTRGKGLAVAAAIIGRYLHHNAARKAVTEVMRTHKKGTANGFVLRLADAILNSSLAAGAETFGSAKFVKFTPSAYAAEFAKLQAERAKKAEAEAAKKAEVADKTPDKPSDAKKPVQATAKTTKPK